MKITTTGIVFAMASVPTQTQQQDIDLITAYGKTIRRL